VQEMRLRALRQRPEAERQQPGDDCSTSFCSGPRAADFHIAFYLGKLITDHPASEFCILSKDRGFDSLVRHLSRMGIKCRRESAIGRALNHLSGVASSVEKPPKSHGAAEHQARVAKVLELLRGPPRNRPITLKRLSSAVNTHLGGKLSELEITRLMTALKKLDAFSETTGRLTYGPLVTDPPTDEGASP
jgi:hypothetical protein